jgi:hypothetical protein
VTSDEGKLQKQNCEKREQEVGNREICGTKPIIDE